MDYKLNSKLMQKIIPWQNGTGNITLTYEGQGDGPVLIESDPNNLYVNRSKVLHVQAGQLTVDLTINQAAHIIDYVDLGLPSGRLWAKGNIVKDAQGNYSIGAPSDYGCYFSWGNIIGHNNGEGYNFGSSISGPYASTPGAQVNANIASDDSAHDAALACLGSPWHLPTKEDFNELYDNTDVEWTTLNGINGWKLMKKSDHSVYVFFTAAGYGSGDNISAIKQQGRYWASSWYSADEAYRVRFNNSGFIPQDRGSRHYGASVRAVR